VCGRQVKLCDPLCYIRAISDCFRDKGLTYKALYKFFCLLSFFPLLMLILVACKAKYGFNVFL